MRTSVLEMAQAELDRRATEAARAARPSLRRSRHDRIVGGVAAGIGEHLGFDPLWVRVAFVVLAIPIGFGVVVYLLLWLLAPLEPMTDVAVPRPRLLHRPTMRQLGGAALVLAGVLVLLWVTGFWFGQALAWPVALAAVGFAILWARTSDEGRSRWDLSTVGTPFEALMSGRISVPRLLFGTALILAGMGVFLAATTSLSAAANVILAVLVTLGGLALLGGPWVWGMATQLLEERASRVRSEARAEMAAHLHDSVLQTLALIQRAREPRQMATLARTQERELRAWLYGRAPSVPGARLRDAIDAMAGRIESAHRVNVEAVVVGDAPLDEPMRALLGATSEATLNAARHSGATTVAVYLEVEPASASAFIRDEGRGFDPNAVPADRRGTAESIVGRMERHGGRAEIHSRPGGGTEVALFLPRRGER